MTTAAATEKSKSQSNRWIQLLLGLVAMMAISSPQYVWTLFTGPLNQKLGTTLAEIQVTFSLLIVISTFCSPLLAFLVDRFGPRVLFSIGALMSGAVGCSRPMRITCGPCTSSTGSSAASALAS